MSEVTPIINVTATGEVLTILQGDALEQKHPNRLDLEGDITAIKSFLAKRYGPEAGVGLQSVDKGKVIITVDEPGSCITLELDPNDMFGTRVTGILSINKDLEYFHINENYQWTREQLVKFLRFNKRFFADPIKYDELLKAYQRLEIQTSTELKQGSDNRGNKELGFNKFVNSKSIPTDFLLTMPIFKGQSDETFRVEIFLEATDAAVRFWFESTALVELRDIRRKQIFAEQLTNCSDFVIIHNP